jgi:hypothetical protein
MTDSDGDPGHPILPDAHRWKLLELTFRRTLNSEEEAYIDLLFTRDGVERRLRFFSPRDLTLEGGLPSSRGMCILDASARQLEGVGVRVGQLDHPEGAPTFWADRVELIDAEP